MFAKAMEDLKKTRVKAPISGLLSNRYVERGDWVSEAGKLFMISDHSKVYLEASSRILDVGKLNVKKIITDGVAGEVTVDSYPGKVFAGKLTYIQPVANVGRLFQVESIWTTLRCCCCRECLLEAGPCSKSFRTW